MRFPPNCRRMAPVSGRLSWTQGTSLFLKLNRQRLTPCKSGIAAAPRSALKPRATMAPSRITMNTESSVSVTPNSVPERCAAHTCCSSSTSCGQVDQGCPVTIVRVLQRNQLGGEDTPSPAHVPHNPMRHDKTPDGFEPRSVLCYGMGRRSLNVVPSSPRSTVCRIRQGWERAGCAGVP
jgi:hypothetical protein